MSNRRPQLSAFQTAEHALVLIYTSNTNWATNAAKQGWTYQPANLQLNHWICQTPSYKCNLISVKKKTCKTNELMNVLHVHITSPDFISGGFPSNTYLGSLRWYVCVQKKMVTCEISKTAVLVLTLVWFHFLPYELFDKKAPSDGCKIHSTYMYSYVHIPTSLQETSMLLSVHICTL